MVDLRIVGGMGGDHHASAEELAVADRERVHCFHLPAFSSPFCIANQCFLTVQMPDTTVQMPDTTTFFLETGILGFWVLCSRTCRCRTPAHSLLSPGLEVRVYGSARRAIISMQRSHGVYPTRPERERERERARERREKEKSEEVESTRERERENEREKGEREKERDSESEREQRETEKEKKREERGRETIQRKKRERERERERKRERHRRERERRRYRVPLAAVDLHAQVARGMPHHAGERERERERESACERDKSLCV